MTDPGDAISTILVADDDPRFVREICCFLEGRFRIVTCDSPSGAVDRFTALRPDLVLLDIEFPTGSGLDVLTALRDHDRTVPVIMLTGRDDARTVVEAMHLGAADFVSKAEPFVYLDARIRRSLERRRMNLHARYLESRVEELEGGTGPIVLGPSAASRRLDEEVSRMAASDANVLITGETGTGKELVARLLHKRSPRRSGPFVCLYLWDANDQMVESRIHGHRRGSFTGAVEDRVGALEAATGGTLLLDEAGDIPLAIQPSLLRVIEYRIVHRVGDHREKSCDTRIVAATNRDLVAAVAKGEFRDDLRHRLETLTLSVPPLRERKNDIPLLARHFLESESYDGTAHTIDDSGLAWLQERDWPGNVRQLRNTLQRAVFYSEDNTVGVADLRMSVEGGNKTPIKGRAIPPPLEDAVLEFERDYLQTVLEAAGNVVKHAAALAGISRKHFYTKLNQTGLR